MAQRIIKFRGKHIETGEWIYGSLLVWPDGKAMIYDTLLTDGNMGGHEVIPNTISQYTGLTDKYGNGVYEGDIVKRHCRAYGLDDIGVVKYDDEKARFVLYCKERHYAKSLSFLKQETINDGQCTIEETFTYEIIGNIHDNPKFKDD